MAILHLDHSPMQAKMNSSLLPHVPRSPPTSSPSVVKGLDEVAVVVAGEAELGDPESGL